MTTATTPTVREPQQASNILSKIWLKKTNDAGSIDQEMNKMAYLKFMTLKAVELLEAKIPSIIDALSKVGLGIFDLGYQKTGDSKVWSADDELRISIRAVPISGKFRFIKYDRIGRNQKTLTEKSKKLESAISNVSGIGHVHVNYFSLETKGNPDNESVLIELWIKVIQ